MCYSTLNPDMQGERNQDRDQYSYGTNPSKNDVISYLGLLDLLDILDEINNIYESQDRIKEWY